MAAEPRNAREIGWASAIRVAPACHYALLSTPTDMILVTNQHGELDALREQSQSKKPSTRLPHQLSVNTVQIADVIFARPQRKGTSALILRASLHLSYGAPSPQFSPVYYHRNLYDHVSHAQVLQGLTLTR